MNKFPFQKNRRLKISPSYGYLSTLHYFLQSQIGWKLLLIWAQSQQDCIAHYHIRRNHSDSVSDDTSKVLPSRLVSDFINGPKCEKEKFKLLTIKNISRFFRSVLRMKMGKDFFQENCLTIFLSGKLGEF